MNLMNLHQNRFQDIQDIWDQYMAMKIFSNPVLLTNIRDVKWVIKLYCNAGEASVTQKGDLKGYGTVWYHPDGIRNILSLNNIQKWYKVYEDQVHCIQS